MEKTLGGDRLGAGKRQKVELEHYNRSTHNLGYLWRSTMSAGTLVPFMKILVQPGDTLDIRLNSDIKTHPTVGPLFGSYKAQYDIFLAPIRLYQGQLHNNKLGIGMNMASVKLPILKFDVPLYDYDEIPENLDNIQINPSCIFSYLGIRGLGWADGEAEDHTRTFNAVPYLAYWDIYKNYYANKQEEIGAVIHTPVSAGGSGITLLEMSMGGVNTAIPQAPTSILEQIGFGGTFKLVHTIPIDFDNVIILTSIGPKSLSELGILIGDDGTTADFWFNENLWGSIYIYNWDWASADTVPTVPPRIQTFALSDIDDMREAILAHSPNSTPFLVAGGTSFDPYRLPFETADPRKSMMYSQEGLALKTYQSDLFNNWLATEWIDGPGGISEVTAIDTSAGDFKIDALLIAKKVYDMLNRIAVSGGSYNDWQEAVYTQKRIAGAESPMYMGGLIKELVFQEVVSNSESGSTQDSGAQPLGTLAGKGIMANKHKGGHVIIHVEELSYVIGIVSLTPRIDYSQGNDWDIHLKTVDDVHKPAMDQIGFQELITEQMAWWTTKQADDGTWVQKSAGKQPAWINYMTSTNKVLGNFAIKDNEMFMTLNRRYEPEQTLGDFSIKDLTTYIDPAKFNATFAQTSLDAQNFWTQISVDIVARRLLSAKVMPNL